jgi:hypothetical protein
MRSASRPRRYVARHWLLILRPLLRYSATRDAYVLRLIGRSVGPVLRPERRRGRRGREQFDGLERRRVGIS